MNKSRLAQCTATCIVVGLSLVTGSALRQPAGADLRPALAGWFDRKDPHLEICSNCHPFFTGRPTLIDTGGRVERFTKKFGAQTSEQRKTAAKAAKAKTVKSKPS